ncbi:alpha/beta fold hydrolase [Klenkia brasiliensis]|uniref:Pimeloyl-ACP methyl ester carboxylesterase n=1 Tax=Klenkia brasiliensis TaxID=333142 RepID=A0A1G7TDN2_9ACTN|nr:alpha/beta hydrolase [Klenkia brasiliensis]SDG33212.1 Pimeloyl-ACP methyl ester carboxylesterase [Klenkia brasiliensis]
MTEHLTLDGGTLAYEVTGGPGPLVVLAHGMGDDRQAYRHLVPRLVEAGYRVAAVDLRGCGESSAPWPSYSRTDIAGDLLALVRHLGGPAVLVGHSISGGAVTVAAARAPELVTALVELTPFTRKQAIALRDLRSARFRRGMRHLLGAGLLGSVGQWRKYLDVAYPGANPADWQQRLDHVTAMLGEPGRMAALKGMGTTPATDAGAALPAVRCPVLVVQGELDPDWADPRAEGEAVLAELPAGLGRLVVLEGAGHYPHHQVPDAVADAVLPFLAGVRA